MLYLMRNGSYLLVKHRTDKPAKWIWWAIAIRFELIQWNNSMVFFYIEKTSKLHQCWRRIWTSSWRWLRCIVYYSRGRHTIFPYIIEERVHKDGKISVKVSIRNWPDTSKYHSLTSQWDSLQLIFFSLLQSSHRFADEIVKSLADIRTLFENYNSSKKPKSNGTS